MATYKKKDNNEKNKTAPANEDDFFSVSSFAEFLKSPTAKRRAASTSSPTTKGYRAARRRRKDCRKDTASGTAPEAEKDRSRKGRRIMRQNTDTAGSRRRVFKSVYKEAQSVLRFVFDAIKRSAVICSKTSTIPAKALRTARSKAVPRGPAGKGVEFNGDGVQKAKAASFSRSVKAAMDAEGGYGGWRFADALDEKPDFTQRHARQYSGAGGKPAAKRQRLQVPSNPPPITIERKEEKAFRGSSSRQADGPLEIFRKCMFLASVVTMVICIGILGNTYLLQPYSEAKAGEFQTCETKYNSWDEVSKSIRG